MHQRHWTTLAELVVGRDFHSQIGVVVAELEEVVILAGELSRHVEVRGGGVVEK
jgi:hypothetical protein